MSVSKPTSERAVSISLLGYAEFVRTAERLISDERERRLFESVWDNAGDLPLSQLEFSPSKPQN